jgi:hypothetical protein
MGLAREKATARGSRPWLEGMERSQAAQAGRHSGRPLREESVVDRPAGTASTEAPDGDDQLGRGEAEQQDCPVGVLEPLPEAAPPRGPRRQ